MCCFLNKKLLFIARNNTIECGRKLISSSFTSKNNCAIKKNNIPLTTLPKETDERMIFCEVIVKIKRNMKNITEKLLTSRSITNLSLYAYNIGKANSVINPSRSVGR
jgi:hypothetical protein